MRAAVFVLIVCNAALAGDAITIAQREAVARAIAAPRAANVDPIRAAQVLATAERVFPNLAAELRHAELLQRAAQDPTVRGNLRGRIAEEDWIRRNRNDGWRAVRSSTAPQNDAYRSVNGRLQGAQIKVHKNVGDYVRSMRSDYLAEKFVLPDDHFDQVWSEWEKRRQGALRGGLTARAAEAARQQARLTKLGRTFEEVDSAIDVATRHYTRISAAMRNAARAASFVGIALAVLDGTVAVYDLAVGKSDVQDFVFRASKAGASAGASAGAGYLAAKAAIAAGASGAVPVAVAIVVGAATYFVVDWAIGTVAERMHVARLTAEDIKRIWPEGLRGVPLERLYGLN